MRMIYLKHCGGDRPYIHPNQLEVLHQEVRRQSIEKFRCARKMGGEEMSQNYQQELEIEILELYGKKFLFFFQIFEKKEFLFSENYKKHNDSKNVFAFSRTPTTFIVSMVIFYVIAGILDTLWLGGINFIFMFGFWVCFGLLFVWLYAKYSGTYAEIGEYIDHFADVIWNNVS
jgi:atlastin